MEQLVSVFENGTPELQYGYVEELGDGRGYTVGRGFTTATGDALAVVSDFVAQEPSAHLAAFLPELRRLAETRSPDTRGLRAAGFPEAWRRSAGNPRFRAAQDAEVERSSLRPALAHARRVGLTTPLGVAVLFDTVVQHGDGDDPDGAGAILAETSAALAGTPRSGVPEPLWLARFLERRRSHLLRAHDPATRAAWAESVPRVDALRDILRAGNFDLAGPLRVGRDFDAVVP